MANLSSKELSSLEDQLGFEKVLTCKYDAAAQESTEADLKNCYRQYAQQHKQNYKTLLNFLN